MSTHKEAMRSVLSILCISNAPREALPPRRRNILSTLLVIACCVAPPTTRAASRVVAEGENGQPTIVICAVSAEAVKQYGWVKDSPMNPHGADYASLLMDAKPGVRVVMADYVEDALAQKSDLIVMLDSCYIQSAMRKFTLAMVEELARRKVFLVGGGYQWAHRIGTPVSCGFSVSDATIRHGTLPDQVKLSSQALTLLADTEKPQSDRIPLYTGNPSPGINFAELKAEGETKGRNKPEVYGLLVSSKDPAFEVENRIFAIHQGNLSFLGLSLCNLTECSPEIRKFVSRWLLQCARSPAVQYPKALLESVPPGSILRNGFQLYTPLDPGVSDFALRFAKPCKARVWIEVLTGDAEIPLELWNAEIPGKCVAKSSFRRAPSTTKEFSGIEIDVTRKMIQQQELWTLRIPDMGNMMPVPNPSCNVVIEYPKEALPQATIEVGQNSGKVFRDFKDVNGRKIRAQITRYDAKAKTVDLAREDGQTFKGMSIDRFSQEDKT